MKRMLLALLCVLLALPALAEAPARVEYADQGGVRVFEEGGAVGLMDAGGNVLLPAEYDCIEPFAGADFAVVHRDGRKGVVRRDGSVVAPCGWDRVELFPEMRLAVCDDDAVDLDTGEVWLSAGELQEIDVDARYVYVLTYGEEGFGYDPPYHTDVYDSNRDLVFSEAAWFVRGFDPDYAVLLFDDDTYGAMDTAGNIIARDLFEPPWTDGQGYAYDDALRTGALHVVRRVKNRLDSWLKPLKLDRHHVEYYLDLLGIDRTRRWAEALMDFYEDSSVCGIVEPDGTTRFEMAGAAIYGPDDAGLYCVQTSGYANIVRDQDMWVYVDRDGNPAIDAKYGEAYPFVDGVAVVRERGRYHLIDTDGNPVGDMTWRWRPDMWTTDALALGVIPIENPDGDGYCVIDRRGEYVTDEVFSDATDVFGGELLILTDRQRRICLMDGSGAVTLRVPTDDCIWHGMDDEAMGVRVDEKWGVMAVVGDRAGKWLIEPKYALMEWMENGCGFRLQQSLDSASGVYADREGNILGPAPHFFAGSYEF